MNGTAVRVRRLRKSYRHVAALGGVDLDIHHGEVFALLGPNGAGKTTAVEILEGYRRRDRGDVAVLGHDPAVASLPWRTRIGIVLQSTSDAQELTVRETVRHFATFYPQPRDPGAVIEQVGLTDKAGYPNPEALRRATAQARRGPRHRRGPGAAVPRRTHDRLRSGGQAAVLGTH